LCVGFTLEKSFERCIRKTLVLWKNTMLASMYTEPVYFSVGMNTEIDESNIDQMFDGWSSVHNWIMSKIIDEDYTTVREKEVSEEVNDTLAKLYNEFGEISPEIVEMIRERLQYISSDIADSCPTVISKSEVLLLVSNNSGYIYLVSEEKENIDALIEEWEEKLGDISPIVSDFGVNIQGLMKDTELAERLLENINGKRIENEEGPDEFEKRVHEEIRENITRCTDINFDVQFEEDYLTETFEYDILCFPSPSRLIIVEVKDESHEDADLDKSDLVTDQREKKDLIEDKMGISTDYFVVRSSR